MKKRFLAALLSLCMLISLLPTVAFAAGAPATQVKVGLHTLDSSSGPAYGRVTEETFLPATEENWNVRLQDGVLTLNNVKTTEIACTSGDLIIESVGTNEIQNSITGISHEGGTLTIQGGGSLRVTGGRTGIEAGDLQIQNTTLEAIGLNGIDASDVTITDSTVTAKATEKDGQMSVGILCDNLQITGENTQVTASGGTEEASYTAFGLYVGNQLTITGGTVEATSAEADSMSAGIGAGSIQVTGGTVTAKGTTSKVVNGGTYGIYSNGADFSGTAQVTAIGYVAQSDSGVGIWSMQSIRFSGSRLVAQGGGYASGGAGIVAAPAPGEQITMLCGESEETAQPAADSPALTEETFFLDEKYVCLTAEVRSYAQVSFAVNGGSGEMPAQKAAYGDYLLPECTLTAPEGQQFAAWAAGSPDGVQYQPGDIYNLTENVTFYALWQEKPEEPVYAIAANPNPLDLGTIETGQEADAAGQVTVRNTGNQPVTVLLPEHTWFLFTEGSGFVNTEAMLEPGQEATFTVQLRSGLPEGQENTYASIWYRTSAETKQELRLEISYDLTAPDLQVGGRTFASGSYATTDAEGVVTLQPDYTGEEAWNLYYDGNTLYLRDATISGGILANRDLVMEMEGNNTVTGAVSSGRDTLAAICGAGALTLRGGTLDVTGGSGAEEVDGIFAIGTLEIRQMNLTVTGGAGTEASAGIFAWDVFLVDSQVTATGAAAETASCGIAGESVTIENSQVTAIGAETSQQSLGITGWVLSVTGADSSLLATAGAAETSCAVNVDAVELSPDKEKPYTVLVDAAPVEGSPFAAECELSGGELEGSYCRIGYIPLSGSGTVSFDANGGSGEMEPVEYALGAWYTLPACEFTAPEGRYYFAGWATSPDGTNLCQPGEENYLTEDVTFYAIWREINFTVIANGTELHCTSDPVYAITSPDGGVTLSDSSNWNLKLEAGVLTLKDAVIGGSGLQIRDALTLQLEGSSTVNGVTAEEAAIIAEEDLTIAGDGTVTVNSAEGANTAIGISVESDLQIRSGTIFVNSGIPSDLSTWIKGLDVDGNLTVTGGTLTAASAASNDDSDGIYVSDNLLISGGTVTATGGETGDETSDSAWGDGIYVGGSAEITGGEVIATGNQTNGVDGESYGIYVDYDLTISGGKVTGTGGKATGANGYSCGIYAYYDLTISGGKVTATGGEAESFSSGLFGFDSCTISGADTEVTGTGGTSSRESYGIYSNGTVEISDGAVTAEAGQGDTRQAICAELLMVDPAADMRLAVFTGADEASAAELEDSPFTEPTDLTDLTQPYFHSEPAFTQLPFTDVPEGVWYEEAVQYVYTHGLMVGATETTFEPEGTVTRGMLIAVLYRLAGKPAAEAAGEFTDVPASAYYAKAIAWAAQEKIAAGYPDGTFRPEELVTREQMAAFLYRYTAAQGDDVSARGELDGYTDAGQISRWAREAMSWANAEGLIVGTSATTLRPGATATRAQLASILKRFA